MRGNPHQIRRIACYNWSIVSSGNIPSLVRALSKGSKRQKQASAWKISNYPSFFITIYWTMNYTEVSWIDETVFLVHSNWQLHNIARPPSSEFILNLAIFYILTLQERVIRISNEIFVSYHRLRAYADPPNILYLHTNSAIQQYTFACLDLQNHDTRRFVD